MTTNNLKKGGESTPETSWFSNIPQTMDNIQHSVPLRWNNAIPIPNINLTWVFAVKLHSFYTSESDESEWPASRCRSLTLRQTDLESHWLDV
jgi:hypothetical protein